LHRTVYSMAGTVMLYTIFRQHRPCLCLGDQVGSIYGMPSGDASHAGVVGAFLLDSSPGHPIIGRIVGVAVMVLVAAERVLLGWHSIGQVVAGLAVGVFCHFYSTRAPQFMVFVDSVFMVIVGLIVVNVDPGLQYKKWDDMNIRSWFTQGLGFILFVCVVLGRHYWLQYRTSQTRKTALWAGLYTPLHSPSEKYPAAGVDPTAFHALSLVPGTSTPPASKHEPVNAVGGGSTPNDVVHAEQPNSGGGGGGGDDDSKLSGSGPWPETDWSITLLGAVGCFVLSIIGYIVEWYATYA